MYINPTWRILTIGDGDLSFSVSLLKHYNPTQLTATVFDEYHNLEAKYGKQYWQNLHDAGCQVLTGFDVTKPNTWGNLIKQSFDVVIFQFPLVPAFTSHKQYQNRGAIYKNKKLSINILNRQLLRKYLQHCFTFFLDTKGENLAYITSKEVKPYSHWNIESSIVKATNINYIGKTPFDIRRFPDYKIRNVDRDKHVKSTTSYSYIYSIKTLESLNLKNIMIDKSRSKKHYCHLCKVGPFGSEKDKNAHEITSKHQKMLAFEEEWEILLNEENSLAGDE